MLMTDIIVITYDEFVNHKNKNKNKDIDSLSLLDMKVKSIMKDIVAKHECFSHNYRYVPHKDENYKHKLSNYMKKHKVCFVVEKNDKYVFSLMNKLTTSNYDTLKTKILESIAQVDIDVSINKIINYSKISNLYTKLICNIIKELYEKNNDIIDDIIKNFIDDYKEHYDVDNYLKIFDDLSYDDYDEFCDHHKKSSMMHNTLNTIIQMIKTIECQNTEVYHLKQLFDDHVENISSYYENNTEHHHINMILYELFTHVELMIDSTKILEMIDVESFNKLCQDVKGMANNKLKFKVTDIMEKL